MKNKPNNIHTLLDPPSYSERKRGGMEQCSRLKPLYEFHSEGLSNFSPSTEKLVQIQGINPRI